MFPLKAILIGRDEETLPHIRRELSNCSAHVEAEFQAAEHAIEALRSTRGEKRLLLYLIESGDDIEVLARMTALFPGWPAVILMHGDSPASAHNALLISAMRAGASQVIPLPLCPKDFKAALDRVAMHFVYALYNTRVIAVAGVTGGCGATTLAVNLAQEIASRHRLRCVLVDLSLKMGVVATHLNIQPAFSILDLLRDVRRVDVLLLERVLVEVSENFRVLAGPNGLVPPWTGSPRDLGRIIDTLKQISDVIVLDVPCTYDDLYFDCIADAEQAVLIGEQSLPSIRALKLVCDTLGQGTGQKNHLLINRYEPKKRDFAVDRLLKPLGVPRLLTVARDDVAMANAMENGCTLQLAAPRSAALSDIGALAELLLDRKAAPPSRPAKLLGRLCRALSNA